MRDCLRGRKAVFLSCCTYRHLCPLTPPQDSAFYFVTFNSSKELSVAAVQLRGQMVTDLNNFSRGGYTHRDACSAAHVKTHAHMRTHTDTHSHRSMTAHDSS